MPTTEQLQRIWETEMEFPSTRREEDPAYVSPADYSKLHGKRETDVFIQGYACCIATLIRSHGIDTPIEDAFKAGIGRLKVCIDAGVDEYDLEILKQHFK